jgi:photosynthetic reaction center cytochrome c subunit
VDSGLNQRIKFESAQEALMRKLAHPVWKIRYLLLAVMALGVVPAMAQDTAQAPKLAEEAYKNIQVFKGMPAPHLMEAMHAFKDALGVKCSFCHVQGDFASDDKPEKATARKMVLMARGINKDNFGGERKVTCYTCHRGATEPESKAPQAEQPK